MSHSGKRNQTTKKPTQNSLSKNKLRAGTSFNTDTKYFFDNIQIVNKYRTGLFHFITRSHFSMSFFANVCHLQYKSYLGPTLGFFKFTLYQHSFNFKELALDLQQRKTRLSVSELELKMKNKHFRQFVFPP